jgi:tryptophan-rich sensory protein
MAESEAGGVGTSGGVAWSDVFKYASASLLQLALIGAALASLDYVGFGKLPPACAFPLFVFLSLRSRVFSILNNARPNRKAQDGKATPSDIKRPGWTPPGIAFPIIWLSITVLRAISSTMIVAALREGGEGLFSRPILALMLHLVFGDTWNSITNVERRLGVSFLAVFSVLASVCYAVFEFSLVSRQAAFVLLPNAVWISIASVLTGAIWRINTPVQPLLPMKGDGKSAPIQMPFSTLKR